jgi:hypothetical protein
MLLNYKKWKNISESSKPDVVYYTLFAESERFSEYQIEEALKSLFSKLKLSKFEKVVDNINTSTIHFSLAEEEGFELFVDSGVAEICQLTIGKSRISSQDIKNIIDKNFRIVRSINRPNASHIITFYDQREQDTINTEFVLNTIHLDLITRFNLSRKIADYEDLDKLLEKFILTTTKTDVFTKEVSLIFSIYLYRELVNAIDFNIRNYQVNISDWVTQNNKRLDELQQVAYKIAKDEISSEQIEEFIIDILELQKKFTKIKEGYLEYKETTKLLVRTLDIFDYSNITDDEIDRLAEKLKSK